MQLSERLLEFSGRVTVQAFRLMLETPGVEATVPMLRGVWGRALHRLDTSLYRSVFRGIGRSIQRSPLYVLRPAPADPITAPAVELILFDVGAEATATLLRAWDVACGMGLGKERKPFGIRRIEPIGPLDATGGAPKSAGWLLSDALWPLADAASTMPCRISFRAPLRLLGKGRLITAPSLADMIIGSLRRIEGISSTFAGTFDKRMLHDIREEASLHCASVLEGERRDLTRWSGSQGRRVDLYGISGEIRIPNGLGNLWPLIVSAMWTHIGKGTVFGLGQPVVEPAREQQD